MFGRPQTGAGRNRAMKLVFAFCAAALLVAACNTVDGVGKDISSAARGVGKAIGAPVDKKPDDG